MARSDARLPRVVHPRCMLWLWSGNVRSPLPGIHGFTRITHLAIPQEIQTSAEIARYLDDLYHEAARPGQSVSVVAE
jgi:hypothetical protein